MKVISVVRRAALALALVSGLASCADRITARDPEAVADVLPTVPTPPVATWLAPLGTGTADPATFDAAAAPVVEICTWVGGACVGSPLVRFSTTPEAGLLPLFINATAGRYEADWSLTSTTLVTRKTYRIRVLQNSAELAAISVDVVRGRWAVTRADGTLAPLASANTLPIRFGVRTPDVEVVRTIGPAGGVVSLPDGVQIDIPSGALTTATDIRLTRMVGYQPPASLQLPASRSSWRLQPEGLTFALPVRVRIPLGALDPAPQGASTLDLFFAHFNEGGSTRDIVSPTVNSQAQTVEFSIHHFTVLWPYWLLGAHTDPSGQWKTFGFKWDIPVITWRLAPSNDPSVITILTSPEIAIALGKWQAVSGLKFQEVDTNTPANLTFVEEGTIIRKISCFNFNLRSTELWGYTCHPYSAYFLFPLLQTFNRTSIHLGSAGMDLPALQVIMRSTLLHEIGHALGIAHNPNDFWSGTSDPDAAAPVMNEALKIFPTELRQSDIEAIQYLYPPAPIIDLSATARAFAAVVGGPDPAIQSVRVLNLGTATLSGLNAAVMYQSGQPTNWLNTSWDVTTAPARLTLSPKTGALPVGTYQATVQITSTATGVTNSPQSVSVSFTVGPSATPEYVTFIGPNPVSLLVEGNVLFGLGGAAGTGNSQVRLLKTVIGSGAVTEPLGPGSPGLGVWARNLRTDGAYLYWQAAGVRFSEPFTIRRMLLTGSVVETVVDDLPLVADHYELYQSDVYFTVRSPDNTRWIKRVAKSGGNVTDVVAVGVYAGFTVGNGEVFYEDCANGTILAQPVNGGVARQVASGLDVTNLCSDRLLLVGNTLFVIATLGPQFSSAVRSVPFTGGVLTTRAAGLNNPVEPVSDGTYLFLRDNPNGEVIRFRLSDFERTTIAPRSCGGLALDATYVYWASELAPAPAQVCFDGGTGPVVRLPKGP